MIQVLAVILPNIILSVGGDTSDSYVIRTLAIRIALQINVTILERIVSGRRRPGVLLDVLGNSPQSNLRRIYLEGTVFIRRR